MVNAPIDSIQLLYQLNHSQHVADCTDAVGAAHGNHVWLAPFLTKLVRKLAQFGRAFRRLNPMDACAEQFIEQHVAIGKLGFRAVQQKLTTQTRPGCGRRGLAAVIRLRRARCNQCVRAPLQGLTDEKFELARLVSAKRKASLIVAFDEQLRPTDFSRKRFQFFDRRGQLGQRKTRERFDSHQTFLPPGLARGQFPLAGSRAAGRWDSPGA